MSSSPFDNVDMLELFRVITPSGGGYLDLEKFGLGDKVRVDHFLYDIYNITTSGGSWLKFEPIDIDATPTIWLINDLDRYYAVIVTELNEFDIEMMDSVIKMLINLIMHGTSEKQLHIVGGLLTYMARFSEDAKELYDYFSSIYPDITSMVHIDE